MSQRSAAARLHGPLGPVLFPRIHFHPFIPLLAALALAWPAVAHAGAESLVKPGDADFRGLLIKTGRPGHYLPAPLLATEVAIDVTGPIARTRVRQHYFNPADEWIEGIYVFPLPDKSAVDQLRMRIGERIIEGEIKERAEARKTYDRAKAEGKRAALLESHRPNIFMSSVANIGPGEAVTIEIAHQETIPVRDGEFRLRVPTVVAPRYFPAGESGLLQAGAKPSDGTPEDVRQVTSPVLRPEAGKINPLRLIVRFADGGGTEGLVSQHHEIATERPGDGSLLVRLADGPVAADRDFELTWPAGRNAARAVLFTEVWQGRHYSLVMLTPPGNAEGHVVDEGREIIFVMDTSGSMAGHSIRQAKESLRYALSRLAPTNRFNLIRFNSTTDALFDGVVPASARNRLLAERYVGALKAEGGTEMRGALLAALDGSRDPSRLRQVVFITDGAVGNERRLFDTITRRLGDARLYTVGIGSAPNRYFMRGAARQGRGTFTFIGGPDQVESRMQALWAKLARPVITDLSVRPESGGATELWPDPVPDLFAGEPIYVAIRFDDAPADLLIEGKGRDGAWRRRLSLSDAARGSGIAKLWAREKIASLQTLRYRDVPPEEIRERTTSVALAHGLVTRDTSLVAVDRTPAREDGTAVHTRKLPHNLPFRWEYDKVFGTRPGGNTLVPGSALRDRARTLFQEAGVVTRSQPSVPSTAGTQEAAKTLRLPQTATPQTLYLAAGTLALAGTLLLLCLTRAHRRRG